MRITTLDRRTRALHRVRNLCLIVALVAVWAHPVRAANKDLIETGGGTIRVPVFIEKPGFPGGFEIDGNLLSAPGGLDWFPSGGTGVIDPTTCAANPAQLPAVFGHDNEWRQGIDGKFKTLSNKNNDWIAADLKPWNWESFGGNPQKNDITEIFAHSRQDNFGDTWVIMAAATRAPQGDNHTDFEFNQAGLTITGSDGGLIIGNGPDNGRTIGDLLVSVDEVIGGRVPVPTLRRWNGTEFILIPESEWTGKFFAANNNAVAPSPCGVVDQKGDRTSAYELDQFLEVAVNTRLMLNPEFGGVCGSPATVMVKTRSSHSFVAELKDFALVNLGTPTLPACAIEGPSVICAGQPAELCGPDAPNLSYLWSTGETTRCITVNAGATYSLTITSAGCPSTTCTKTVTTIDPPTCEIDGPPSLCAGASAQLCGPDGPGLTYLWSTGETSRCITIFAPGSYTLTVTRAGCATASCTNTKVVTPGPPAECVITGSSTICAGTPTELCGPEGAGLTYLWSTGETTRCIMVTAQATYSLTVSGGPCGPATCEKIVRASSPPICTIKGPDTLCVGQTGQLCGPEGFQGTQFTYLWSTGSTNRCITINGPGTYTLTVSTPDCGSITCSKTVIVGDAVGCSITGPDDLDPGQTGQLCGPDGPGLTYLWSTGETSRCIDIPAPGTYTLTVTSGDCGSSTCTKVVRDRPTSSCRCSIGYPNDSNLPRSAQAFHGSSLLRAVVPGRDGCPIGDQKLKLWYNDATAMALGIHQVVVYTSPTDSTVTNFSVTPSPGSPACVTSPQYGATAQSGLLTGNDTAVDGGRPIWPVLYMTDITLDKDSKAGDWQQGSTAGIPADEVCGVWTTGVRRVYQHLGTVSVAMDPSPAPNGWTLGAGSDVPPGGFGAYANLGYGAQASWDLSALSLVPGHRYRLYTMIHGGNQAVADGGAVGHACTRVVVPQVVMIGTGDEDGGLQFLPDEVSAKNVGTTALPSRFELSQNFPNPFSAGSRTAIRFSLPERSQVKVGVFTIAGQRVGTLADGTFEPGHQVVEWDGSDGNDRTLAPGLYVCKLEASSTSTGQFVQMRKMLMVK